MNQLRLHRRWRSCAMRSGRSAKARMSSSAGGIGTPRAIAMSGEECQPAGCDFPIGPQGDDVGTSAQNGVVVSLHDRVGADFNSEDGREIPQPVDQPCLAVGEVPERQRVESAQKCPADAPAEAVIHPFLSFLDVCAARQTHGSPLLTLLTADSWKVPRKTRRKMGVQVLPVASNRYGNPIRPYTPSARAVMIPGPSSEGSGGLLQAVPAVMPGAVRSGGIRVLMLSAFGLV